MWKKFTDLLFEDDDSFEEEEVVEEIVTPKPKSVVKPITVSEIKPEPVKVEPLVDSIKFKEQIVEEKPKQSISMVVDDLQEVKTQVKVPEAPVRKPRIVPVSKPEPKNTYEFTPVISPIFGISEKDVNAVIPTNPHKKKAITDSKIGTVISPMYGIDKDNEPDALVGNIEPKTSSVNEIKAEEEVPNFSLDEILARRNKESNDNSGFFKPNELSDDVDKTIVLSNHNMSLFDDED